MSEDKELTQKETLFCEFYIERFNGTQSYLKAYPDTKNDNVAGVEAHNLLRKPKIKDFIKEIQVDLAEIAGISRLRVLREHEKIAFSSIAHLHETWIDRTDFEKLTDEQKACIQDIKTKTRSYADENGVNVEIEEVQVKLYSKEKALDSISKMLGFNEPEKHNVKLEVFEIIEPEF